MDTKGTNIWGRDGTGGGGKEGVNVVGKGENVGTEREVVGKREVM